MLQLTSAVQAGTKVTDVDIPGGWACDSAEPMNTANRLTIICLDLPNVKSQASELLEGSTATKEQLYGLLKRAQTLDKQLEAWNDDLPDFWRPQIAEIVTDEPPKPKEADLWTGPVLTYGDLNIANVINDYRVSRIFCQAVILGCLEALPAREKNLQTQKMHVQAEYISRVMVDEFASTVPYLLGYNYYSRADAHPNDEAASKSTGAYYAVWPLFVTLKIPCIQPKLKAYLLGRLDHIGATFGLLENQVEGYAQDMTMRGQPVYIGNPPEQVGVC
jgi:hypothetical protein